MGYTDSLLFAFWVIIGWIEPSFSFASGSIIYYLLQVERGDKNLSLAYFSILLVLSIIAGHYSYYLLPLALDNATMEESTLLSINFILGLFSKILLDIIVTKEFGKIIMKRGKK